MVTEGTVTATNGDGECGRRTEDGLVLRYSVDGTDSGLERWPQTNMGIVQEARGRLRRGGNYWRVKALSTIWAMAAMPPVLG